MFPVTDITEYVLIEDEMCRTCNTHINTQKILVGKSERKKSLGRPRHR
jgi:hypothetical protein